MLALACALLFALAAVAALGAMTSAIHASRPAIASLSRRHRHPSRELTVSWRIAGAWDDLRGQSGMQRPHAWAPQPERLAA